MTFPAGIKYKLADFRSNYASQVTRSFSGNRTASKTPGHYWSFKLNTGLLTPDQKRELYAFAIAQEGRYNVFTIVHPVMSTPRGSTGGTPLTNASFAAGLSSITTDGWPNSTLVLKLGDLFKFASHDKVYMVTGNDVTSNGSGVATINFHPQLLKPVVNNEALTVNNVPFQVSFAEDIFSFEQDVQMAGYTQFELQLEEVWG